MSTAFDKFQELETRIVRAVDLVKSTREELAGARTQISRLERELDELRRERELVKNRVETLLGTLSELTEEESAKAEVAVHRR